MTIGTGIAIFGLCWLIVGISQILYHHVTQTDRDNIYSAIAQLGRRIEELERIIQD